MKLVYCSSWAIADHSSEIDQNDKYEIIICGKDGHFFYFDKILVENTLNEYSGL